MIKRGIKTNQVLAKAETGGLSTVAGGSRGNRKRISPFDPVTSSVADNDKTTARYLKGQVVFAQGDAADTLFYIQTGKLKLTVVSNKGKEAVVALLGAGDFLGEGCLAGRKVRLSTASALSECILVRLEKAEAIRLLRDEPAFAESFLQYLLSRNIRIEEDLVDQLFNSSEKRLARVLLLLANFDKEERRGQVIPKMSQETLAEIVGTTRSRVSFFMNKFRNLGFIAYHGDIEVHSSLFTVFLPDKTPARKGAEAVRQERPASTIRPFAAY